MRHIAAGTGAKEVGCSPYKVGKLTITGDDGRGFKRRETSRRLLGDGSAFTSGRYADSSRLAWEMPGISD
jgi:hypothetical protein